MGRAFTALVALAACAGPPVATTPERARPPRIAIVVSEAGPEGARLVAIDEHGDRQLELLQPPEAIARDTNPTISPDGKWIVFASSRGRSIDQTSLWIAPLGPAMEAHRLTDGTAIDAQPTWTPDGKAIVFASTRDRGNFDLWRLAVHDGAAGALTQLTHGPQHEVTPAVAADGTIIYAEVTPDEEHHTVETHLEQRSPGGEITQLTTGPADSSPAISPDGTRLAFARPQPRFNKVDSELWVMDRKTGAITPLVNLPFTDESGPVWSPDGRFVLATSVFRGEADRVIFSSIIEVDATETAPVAHILEDRVGAIARLTPAVATRQLDVRTLHADPEYLPELARIMDQMIEQAKQSSGAP